MTVMTPLDEVADIVSGFGFPEKLQGRTEGELPFFKVGDISAVWKAGERLLTKANHYLTAKEAEKIRAKAFPKGTIVFAKIGEALKLNRRAILGQSSLIDNNVMGLIPNEKEIDALYLFYFMLTVKLGDMSQATTVPSVRKSDVKAIEVPIVPLKEQKLIVAEIEKQFSRLDKAAANIKRVKANLKRYKAAVLKAAVEGTLTEEWRKTHPDVESADILLRRVLLERKKKWETDSPGKKYKEPAAAGNSNLPKLPVGWVWSRTDQLFCYVTSGSRGWASYYSETGAAFLRMGNLDHDTIDLDLSDVQRVQPPEGSEGTRTRVLSGDILISITADVGMVGIVPADFEEAYINQHVALARSNAAVNHVYLAWFLACKNGQDQLQNLQRGATKVGLGLDDIKSVDVALPPAKEQDEIVAEIERHFSIVGDVEAEVDINLKRAERLRQAILRQAYTGHI